MTTPVERHYTRSDIVASILAALERAGRDISRLAPADLAPVDAFHMRGRAATVELARRAGVQRGMRVLDVGSGLGGSARYLANEHDCEVTGIDLTHSYVEAARELARLVGLERRVRFEQASATALPFPDASFDLAWTEHVQMNIADKRAFYGEIARVLVPGGRLAFHDVFQGPGGAPIFPVPWAADASISALATPETVRALLVELGFDILEWVDVSAAAANFFAATREQAKTEGIPILGLHVFLGESSRESFPNLARSVREARVVAIQAIAERRGTPCASR